MVEMSVRSVQSVHRCFCGVCGFIRPDLSFAGDGRHRLRPMVRLSGVFLFYGFSRGSETPSSISSVETGKE